MAVSSDGVVTATIDTATASVLLTIDFTVAAMKLNGAASAVSTITVTEQTSGRTVRGLTSVTTPGAVTAGIDHEAVFGSSLSYVARAVSTTSGSGFDVTSAAASVTLSAPSSSPMTWLKSLATPSASCLTTTVTLPAWDADIAQGVIRVIDRPDPIVVSDVRQYETGTLEVLTTTGAQESAMASLLGLPGPYLLQMPTSGSGDRYVTVGKVSRKRSVNQFSDAYRVWTLPLVQVARPDPTGWQVAIPGHTYADSARRFPTYADRTGTYLSRATS